MGLDLKNTSSNKPSEKPEVVNEKKVKEDLKFKLMTKEEITKTRIQAYDYCV